MNRPDVAFVERQELAGYVNVARGRADFSCIDGHTGLERTAVCGSRGWDAGFLAESGRRAALSAA